jgi:hypothetical protein
MHLCIESLNMAGGNQQCAKKRRGIQKAHATVGSNICKKRAPRAEECAGKKQQRAQKAIYATRNGCMLTGRVAPNLSHGGATPQQKRVTNTGLATVRNRPQKRSLYLKVW